MARLHSSSTTAVAAALVVALLFLSACASGQAAATSEAAPTPTPDPGDPRAAVCGFEPGTFDEGIVDTETGTSVYVAVQGERADSLAPAGSATTTNTLCLSAQAVADEISCGSYLTDSGIPITVLQSGLWVVGSWHVDGAASASADTSSLYWSACSEEIYFQTGGFAGSSLLDAGQQESYLAGDHIVAVADRLEVWSALGADETPLAPGSCSALDLMAAIEASRASLQQDLDLMIASDIRDFDERSAQTLERFQSLISDAFELIEEDSPVFEPVFEVWFSAHFEWPVIVDAVDSNDPNATTEERALALMGPQGRHGLVVTGDSSFAWQAETVSALRALGDSRCV